MAMSTGELTASGMMSLARVQQAPLSPTTYKELPPEEQQHPSLASHLQHQQHASSAASASSASTRLHSSHEPLKHEYLGMKLSDKDMELVQDFEHSWARFVQQKADVGELPKGRREKRLEQLQQTLRTLKSEQDGVESQLLQQWDFVRQQAQTLPLVHGTKVAQAQQQLAQIQQHWNSELTKANKCANLQEETLPWFHFVRQLDLQASLLFLDHKTTAMRPSARATCLLGAGQLSKEDTHEQLRAYRTDQALLNSHIAMLHKELERCQLTQESQERAGDFLTQHNVWSIVSLPEAPQPSMSDEEFFDCQEEKKEGEDNHKEDVE